MTPFDTIVDLRRQLDVMTARALKAEDSLEKKQAICKRYSNELKRTKQTHTNLRRRIVSLGRSPMKHSHDW